MSIIENLKSMLARGHDSALLRYGLGNEYLKASDPAQAAAHLAEAVRLDPNYSAAWKLYGKSLAALGQHAQAIAAYDQGIATAERQGDIQAAKEMRVFRRRAEKDRQDGAACRPNPSDAP